MRAILLMDSQTSSGRRLFLLLLAFLFGLDVSKHLLILSTGTTELRSDAAEYWDVAGRVAEGDLWQSRLPVDYRTPLYPAFLGFLRWLFADNAMFSAAVIQHLLVILTSVLTTGICYRLSGSFHATLLAYSLCMLCLTRAWFANVLLTESHFTLFLTASVGVLAEYFRNPRLMWASTFGFLLGMTVLIRPVPQLLWIPLIPLFLLNRPKESPIPMRRRLLHAGVSIIFFQSMLVPWSVRNWLLFDEYFLTRLPTVNKWQVCFQGGAAPKLPLPMNEAGLKIASVIPTVVEEDNEVARYSYAVVAALANSGLSQREIDKLVTEACAAAITEHPQRFMWFTLKRFVNFWRCCVQDYPFYSRYKNTETSANVSDMSWRIDGVADWVEWVLQRPLSRHLQWNQMITVVTTLGVLLLSIPSRTRWFGISLGLLFLYFASVTAVVEIENYRYRMVLEPCMILAITVGFTNLSAISPPPKSTPVAVNAEAGIPRVYSGFRCSSNQSAKRTISRNIVGQP